MTDIAVITGASTGLGAAYADRFARRGYDLLLVARNETKLNEVAAEIRETGRSVEVLPADLTDSEQLAAVERRIRADDKIDVVVNNAGGAWFGSMADVDTAEINKQVALNVTSLAVLSSAAAANFAAKGRGTIVNLASALALNILPNGALYAATKSFVLALTLGMQLDLGDKGVRVQAVLPGAVRTSFWDGSGIELSYMPNEIVMTVDDAVDAALAGLDSGEQVTIPSLPDAKEWADYDSARLEMAKKTSLATPADRYKV